MSPLWHQVKYSEFMENLVTVSSLGPGATGDIDMDKLDARTNFGGLTEELLEGKDETALYTPIVSDLQISCLAVRSFVGHSAKVSTT